MVNCTCNLHVKTKMLGRFCDMSKDCDNISHDVLVNKFKFYGFDNNAVKVLNHIIIIQIRLFIVIQFFSYFFKVKTVIHKAQF